MLPNLRDDKSNFDYVLIDGDLLVFAICAAIEYGREEGEFELSQVTKVIDKRIAEIMKRVKARFYRIYFSHSNNFRKTIDPEYKSNRKDVWRPSLLKPAIDYCMKKHKGIMQDGLEADDLLVADINERSIVASLDKDIPQNVGHYYKWETSTAGERFIEVEASNPFGDVVQIQKANKKEYDGKGIKFFCHQLLIGDPTDGIMGCGVRKELIYKSGVKKGEVYLRRVGVGAGKAYELLESTTTYGEAIQIVIKEYKKVFGDDWEQMLLMNGRCLHMVSEIDKDGCFRLWSLRKSQADSSWFNPKTNKMFTK